MVISCECSATNYTHTSSVLLKGLIDVSHVAVFGQVRLWADVISSTYSQKRHKLFLCLSAATNFWVPCILLHPDMFSLCTWCNCLILLELLVEAPADFITVIYGVNLNKLLPVCLHYLLLIVCFKLSLLFNPTSESSSAVHQLSIRVLGEVVPSLVLLFFKELL